MRQLHVVAVSDDGSNVLLATSPDAARPTHRVAIDDRLRAAIRGVLPPPGAQSVESALSPKEIQARLRAGATPEEVARAAGVPLTRILRYAGPVLSERDRVVDEARAAHLSRPRRGASALPLGEAVDAHLSATSGFKRDSADWAARRSDDGTWVVTLTFSARGRRSAAWSWHPGDRKVVALDPLANRLGYDEEPGAATPARPRARKTARKAAPKQAAGTKTAPKKATAKKAVAPKKAAAKKTAAKKATAKKAAARPAARKRAAKQAARTEIPSWSDVLMGVGGSDGRRSGRGRSA